MMFRNCTTLQHSDSSTQQSQCAQGNLPNPLLILLHKAVILCQLQGVLRKDLQTLYNERVKPTIRVVVVNLVIVHGEFVLKAGTAS